MIDVVARGDVKTRFACSRQTAIGLVDDGDAVATVAVFIVDKFFEYLNRSVLGAIVDEDELDVRVRLREYRVTELGNISFYAIDGGYN